ncbi:MAG TPA: peptidoglycan-associated lipoprotein Pal [Acidobacteriota bacterium]|nr:peptidoglycan-associated lipoprotein Pal [Acidobacteriota bacterium]HRV07007.1 peptidoglycan-associated lipoprotein Pal [Acidobacteriota bacterium]
MKQTRRLVFLLILLLGILAPAGCKKKPRTVAQAPTARPAPTAPAEVSHPAPEVKLSASPTTIRRGEQSTLTWEAENADSVVIDNGVGNVASRGSVTVTPLESTTYTARAIGPGGEAQASARVTVVRGEPTGEIEESDVQALRKAIDEGLIRPVFFAYDSSELTDEAKAILEENSRWFRRYPNARIIIEGHCDERGTEEYNLALGDRRARAARDYLVQLGISPDRIETISYGEERPFALGHDESAWRLNRRAHFVVQ